METKTSLRGGAGETLVFVDDLDSIGRPAQLHGKINERILTGRRFLMVEHLLRAGLSHVDDRGSLQMVGLKLL